MSITLAFIKKEFLQIIRDPSSLIIAFVLPTLLLFIYAYGINLDFANVRLGIKNDDGSPATEELAGAFGQNRFITAVRYDDRKQMQADLTRAKIQGALTIPSDFTRRLAAGKDASLQLITDGANINQVGHTQNYVNQIVSGWLQKSGFATAASPAVEVQARYRYNQNADGRRALVPSSLAVTMTLIGILLTALVVSREWERGTMEALLAANIRPIHIVIGKYVPYFVVGMLSLTFSMFVIIFVFGLPFGGSYWVLFIVSALFLYASLGIGLIISSLLRAGQHGLADHRLSAGADDVRRCLSDPFNAAVFPLADQAAAADSLRQLHQKRISGRHRLAKRADQFVVSAAARIFVFAAGLQKNRKEA